MEINLSELTLNLYFVIRVVYNLYYFGYSKNLLYTLCQGFQFKYELI
jgi:hypothetical protein